MLSLPLDGFLVLGHRGVSAYVRENTAAAFHMAGEMGADGVELDVRRTSDGQLVVHHDAVLPGGEIIGQLTRRAISEAAPHVVSLDEAMEACNGLIVNIEIKNSPTEPDFDPSNGVADSVAERVIDGGWHDRVLVSSFNPATVDRIRHLSAAIATGQLIDPGSDVMQQLIAAHRRGHQALHPHVSSLDHADKLIEVASRLGMWIVAWTVNDAAVIAALKRSGVHGVITDDPGLARSIG